MDSERSSLSGLTHSEAKEFHSLFMLGFLVFAGIALVAHILVWLWRPWFPAEGGYETSMIELPTKVAELASFVA